MIRPFRLVPLVLFGMTCYATLLPQHPAIAQPRDVAKPAFLSLGDFTLNLPEGSEQLTYVVVSITLEISPGVAMELKGLEPRLKEIIMRRLLTMAERHVLQPGHTDPMVVKASLLQSISAVQPAGIHDVLITRLLYG
jgi:flagellar basal body-associated protein FliL